MLLQDCPEVEYPPELYASPSINLILFIGFIALLWVSALFYYRKGKTYDLEATKKIIYGYGHLGLFYGITRFFFVFAIVYDNCSQYSFLINLGYPPGLIGFSLLIGPLERVKYKKKYFTIASWALTIVTTVGVFLSLFVSGDIREIFLIIILIGTPLCAVFTFVLYIQLIKGSTGAVRKKAIASFIGLMILVVGIVLDGQFILEAAVIPLFLKIYGGPVCCLVGWAIFCYYTLKS